MSFIANLLLNLTMKEFLKLANICESYARNRHVFIDSQCSLVSVCYLLYKYHFALFLGYRGLVEMYVWS